MGRPVKILRCCNFKTELVSTRTLISFASRIAETERMSAGEVIGTP